MARRGIRGRAWGNALGGWRKQRRARNGRFGSGGAKTKTKTKAIARRKKGSSRPNLRGHAVHARSSVKRLSNVNYSAKQVASIAGGTAIGVVGGAILLGGPGAALGGVIGFNNQVLKSKNKPKQINPR